MGSAASSEVTGLKADATTSCKPGIQETTFPPLPSSVFSHTAPSAAVTTVAAQLEQESKGATGQSGPHRIALISQETQTAKAIFTVTTRTWTAGPNPTGQKRGEWTHFPTVPRLELSLLHYTHQPKWSTSAYAMFTRVFFSLDRGHQGKLGVVARSLLLTQQTPL